jgi:hypothetical protein
MHGMPHDAMNICIKMVITAMAHVVRSTFRAGFKVGPVVKCGNIDLLVVLGNRVGLELLIKPALVKIHN